MNDEKIKSIEKVKISFRMFIIYMVSFVGIGIIFGQLIMKYIYDFLYLEDIIVLILIIFAIVGLILHIKTYHIIYE